MQTITISVEQPVRSVGGSHTMTIKDVLDVPAYLHGKFAVHLPPASGQYVVNMAEAYYNVTHIATGLRITGVWGRANARKVARVLDAAVREDITAEDQKSKTPQWRAFVATVKPFVGKE